MVSCPQALFPVHRDYLAEAIVIRAIGHPLRLKILYEILSKQSNAKKISTYLAISEADVSHHLAVLKDAGVVTGYRKGSEVFYTIGINFIKILLSDLNAS